MTDHLNTALLAYMLDGAAPIWGRLKAQKAPFFVEYELQRRDMAASTFSYMRWRNGPFSQALWNSFDYLLANGFMHRHDGTYGLTDRGLFLVDLVGSLRDVEANAPVFAVMGQALRHCKTRSGQVLMDEAYAIELEPAGLPGSTLKIQDVPSMVSILEPEETTLVVPGDLMQLITCELSMPQEELDAARCRQGEFDREAIKRLVEATPEGLPS